MAYAVVTLLSFFFIFSHILAFVLHVTAEQCPSSCGNITIEPPVTVRGSPSNCVNPRQSKYELTCDSSNHAILNLFSSDYYVTDISYSSDTYQYITMKVIDVDMANPSCRLPLHSLPASKFMSPDNPYNEFPSSNIWVSFVNCSNEVKNNTMYRPVPCLRKADNKIFVYAIASKEAYRVGNLASSCSFLAMTAMRYDAATNDSGTDIFKLLAEGFTLLARGSRVTPFLLEMFIVTLGTIINLVVAHTLFGRFVVGPLIICGFLSYKFRKMIASVDNVERFLRMQKDLVPTRYSYTDLIALTSHFKEKLGHGGFGSVFKGRLPGNRLLAIKMLEHSKANGEDFINEVSTIGRIHHVNVVRLIGFCSDGSHKALVYEYMANGSLDKFIFSSNNGSNHRFSLEKLTEIALGIARGIDYLHQGCDMQILHFDIKPHNILLDHNFMPKISDFGLAKLYPRDYNFVTLSVARGTIGYIAPELISRSFGLISHKSDVYSFGMLLLEMAGGRKNADQRAEITSRVYYPSWIFDKLNNPIDHDAQEIGTGVAKLVISDAEKKLCMIGLWCIQMRPFDRPSMSKVIEMLEGDVEDLQMPPKPFFSDSRPPILSLPCSNISQEELNTSSDDIVCLV
ncbi:Glycerophosphodiester phosphodiesterase protein [Dioscorea alata]|uniref:Glycerophosphodiester phosphodiesterase protein n=1 Tax=Dioscorea alata TaxID=55571 RepID=A0ACB7W5I0_DIOAL|nr:Glycerophosphodiester phosphodiesterase protein [Dioscorea alata]